LPGGISFLSTWEFAATVDPCEPFTGVEWITVDGVNRVGSHFLGPQFAGAPGPLGTLSPSWGSLVYLTQLTISAGEVKGLIPYSVGNLNLQIFFWLELNLRQYPRKLWKFAKPWNSSAEHEWVGWVDSMGNWAASGSQDSDSIW
jgi:hypothetical protein